MKKLIFLLTFLPAISFAQVANTGYTQSLSVRMGVEYLADHTGGVMSVAYSLPIIQHLDFVTTINSSFCGSQPMPEILYTYSRSQNFLVGVHSGFHIANRFRIGVSASIGAMNLLAQNSTLQVQSLSLVEQVNVDLSVDITRHYGLGLYAEIQHGFPLNDGDFGEGSNLRRHLGIQAVYHF